MRLKGRVRNLLTYCLRRFKKEATEATDPVGNIQDMELREEWQDDEFPRHSTPDHPGQEVALQPFPSSAVASNTLELSGRRHMRKRLQAPDLSEGSVKSGEVPESTPDGSLDINLDELETPSESEFQEGPESGHEFEWEGEAPGSSLQEAARGGVGAADTKGPDGRLWRIFLGDDHEHKVDLSTIEPYTRVISHGGYCGEGLNAVLVFASCYLPESSVPNYPYIMENLFRYIIGTLELMVAENYMLVCLNGATSRRRFPPFTWIKQCYQTIDRRLRKNLKSLVIVHPTWYIKALMTVFKPFISSKFSQKVKFVDTLDDLGQIVPLQQMHIPACVQQ
uniref:BCL2 interacting protein like n=1 Tax=Pseudonaja textilis TaxID=8673 RepID=A0A670ZD37_PSETE